MYYLINVSKKQPDITLRYFQQMSPMYWCFFLGVDFSWKPNHKLYIPSLYRDFNVLLSNPHKESCKVSHMKFHIFDPQVGQTLLLIVVNGRISWKKWSNCDNCSSNYLLYLLIAGAKEIGWKSDNRDQFFCLLIFGSDQFFKFFLGKISFSDDISLYTSNLK